MSEYGNLAICDLRHVTDLETIRQIEEIHNVALLILAKDAGSEVKSALAGVPMHNIGSMIYIGRDSEVRMINGVAELKEADFDTDADTVHVINGIAAISRSSKMKKASVIVNGILAMHESIREGSPVSFIMVNGITTYADYDSFRAYQESMILDAATLNYMGQKTMLATGGSIRVEEDVTAEMLKEKNVILLAGGSISFYKSAAPYIRATAVCGGDMRMLPE